MPHAGGEPVLWMKGGGWVPTLWWNTWKDVWEVRHGREQLAKGGHLLMLHIPILNTQSMQENVLADLHVFTKWCFSMPLKHVPCKLYLLNIFIFQ
jgi:hypothetical protein